LNGALSEIGLKSLTQNWLFNPRTALGATLTPWVLYVGFGMVLFLTQISTIPREYYEAAEIDGASISQQDLKITILDPPGDRAPVDLRRRLRPVQLRISVHHDERRARQRLNHPVALHLSANDDGQPVWAFHGSRPGRHCDRRHLRDGGFLGSPEDRAMSLSGRIVRWSCCRFSPASP
jgi:hypothetical protein